MEMLHNLWNILCTEDENLTKYITLTLVFVEIYVTLKLSATILSINYNKKQRNIYIIVLGMLIILSNLFMPSQISIFIHLVLTPIIIKLIF
nr:hypothetical protein [Clostridia bacterium]